MEPTWGSRTSEPWLVHSTKDTRLMSTRPRQSALERDGSHIWVIAVTAWLPATYLRCDIGLFRNESEYGDTATSLLGRGECVGLVCSQPHDRLVVGVQD